MIFPEFTISPSGIPPTRDPSKIVDEKLLTKRHFRNHWKKRKNNAHYENCLGVFNDAMENKIQSYGFKTNHIGYLKEIRQQCRRCKWLKKNNYPYKQCYKNCLGRFEMSLLMLTHSLWAIYSNTTMKFVFPL